MKYRILLFILGSFLAKAETVGERPLDLTYRPSQGDIKAFMNSAIHKSSSLTKPRDPSGCKINYDINKEVNLSQEYACMAIPENSLKKWIFAKDDTVEMSVQQNNDAAPWKIKDEGKTNTTGLSDDKGYTLGLKGQYTRENKDRKINFVLIDDLFTRNAIGPNGKTKSDEGRYYLETLEQINLKMTVEEKTSDPGTRIVGEAGVKYETDSGGGPASQLQTSWHDRLSRYENLRYEKINGNYSKLTADAKIGIKKIVEAETSNFYCSASAQGLVGMDTQGKPIVATQLEGQVSTGSMGDRDKDTPLFAIKLIQEQELRGRDRTSNTELEAGGYVYSDKKGYSVYVGVGRVIHRSKTYTAFTPKEEPIYSVHLRAKKTFKGL